jgi:hypothetical protein
MTIISVVLSIFSSPSNKNGGKAAGVPLHREYKKGNLKLDRDALFGQGSGIHTSANAQLLSRSQSARTPLIL